MYEMIKKLVADLNQNVFTVGNLIVRIYEDKVPKFTRELSALLSITNCHESHELDKKASKKQVIHMSITGMKCSRIRSSTSLSVPMVTPDMSIVQGMFNPSMFSVCLLFRNSNYLQKPHFCIVKIQVLFFSLFICATTLFFHLMNVLTYVDQGILIKRKKSSITK